MKTLYLVLKSKWYDMIASGEKREEYREVKPYWKKRLTASNERGMVAYTQYASTMATRPTR